MHFELSCFNYAILNVSSLLETFNSSLSKLNALCPPSKFEWLPTTCVWKRPYLVKATALLASGPCHKFIIGWHFMIWEKASCWPSLGPFTRYIRHIRTCLHSNEKILKKLMTYKLIMYLSKWFLKYLIIFSCTITRCRKPSR